MWDKIVSFFNKIDEALFELDTSKYEYIDISNPLTDIPKVVFAICIGVIIATLIAYYHKTILGSVVRALAKASAFDEESAVTLSSLSLKGCSFFEKKLKKDSTLSRKIKSVTAEGEETRYYISDENREAFIKRYSSDGSDLKYLIITLVITIAVMCAFISFRNEIFIGIDFLVGFFTID